MRLSLLFRSLFLKTKVAAERVMIIKTVRRFVGRSGIMSSGGISGALGLVSLRNGMKVSVPRLKSFLKSWIVWFIVWVLVVPHQLYVAFTLIDVCSAR